MATMVVLPIRQIVSVAGITQKTARLDADGEIVFKAHEETCAVCGRADPEEKKEAELEPLTTLHLLRQACFAIGNSIRKSDDPQYVNSVMSRVLLATGKERVALPEQTYKWLHRLLERRVPLSKEEKEFNEKEPDASLKLEPRTFADHLWGVSAWSIVQQLTPDGLPTPVEDGELVGVG